MKTLGKFVIGTVAILVGLGLVAGRAMRDAAGYVRASAETTVDGLADGLPREVRDKKLDNDLAHVRAELVERRVKLNQSARQIEQLRTELKAQAERAERDRLVLVEAGPILEAATREKQATVKFATAEVSLADFQHEIDDLLARRARDTQELTIKSDVLTRLEGRQRQAEQALADSGRALEAAEREVALLKSRREHAEIEGRTIALVTAISDSLKAPRESIGESLGRLRDEVDQLESRNEAQRTLAPVAGRPAGETLVREFERVQALRALRAQARAEKAAAEKPEPSPGPVAAVQGKK
jgi:chromosome segregation ATPase